MVGPGTLECKECTYEGSDWKENMIEETDDWVSYDVYCPGCDERGYLKIGKGQAGVVERDGCLAD